jgi:hypothetical protein
LVQTEWYIILINLGFFENFTSPKQNPIANVVKIADMIYNSDLSRLPFPPREKELKRKVKYQVANAWIQLKRGKLWMR